MKIHSSPILFLLCAIVSFGIPRGATALPEPPAQSTANQSLKALQVLRGRQVVSTIVGVAGFYGQDQPQQWRLLAVDTRVPNLLHEYAMQAGKIVGERHFSRRPDEDLPSIVIPPGNLRIDSPQAFAIANENARRAGVGFDSVHYQLRCRDLRKEPVWVINLIDQQQNTVGVQYLSAITGETLRSVWHRPGTQEYSNVNAPDGIFNKLGKTIGDAERSIAKKSPLKKSNAKTVLVPNYRPQPTRTPVQTAPKVRTVTPLPRR